MLNIGKVNRLKVKAEFPFGFHLSTPQDDNSLVTLTKEQAPPVVKVGDEIDVFVGTDEHGELLGYPTPPQVLVGETAVLKAVGATHFGAFFDWGLDKDLLVPAGMQESPVSEGLKYVVHVYYDASTQRLLGATKLHPFLTETFPELLKGDEVECLVYAKTDLGFKVVINQEYIGLIFHSDAFRKLRIGEATTGFIKDIRPDGKIDVALQRIDSKGRKTLEQTILDDLAAHGGLSTLTDRSPPEAIYKHFNVSKAAYKKALGALYKQRKIRIDKQAIRLQNNEQDDL